MRQIWRGAAFAVLLPFLAGCSPNLVLNGGLGPTSLSDSGYVYPAVAETPVPGQVGPASHRGQVGAFEASYTNAWNDQMLISRGVATTADQKPGTYSPLAKADPTGCPSKQNSGTANTGGSGAKPTGGTSPPKGQANSTGGAIADNGQCSYYSIHSRQMAVDGAALVDNYCRDYFEELGGNQRTIQTIRDISSSLGAIGAGAAGVATGIAAAPAALGFTIATATSGLDIYTRNFLFGSDNIDSVRELVVNALATHRAAALPEPDNSAWTFQGAEQVIQDHQKICRPANIVALVRGAIKNAPTQAIDPQGNVVNACQPAPGSTVGQANRPAARPLAVVVPNVSSQAPTCPPEPSKDNARVPAKANPPAKSPSG